MFPPTATLRPIPAPARPWFDGRRGHGGCAPARSHRGLLLGLLLLAVSGRAEVRLASLFGDHAVLQQGMTVPIWGWAAPGATVTVTFADRSARAIADGTGKWFATLPPMPGGLVGDLVVVGPNRVRRVDVATGEVWLCGGQSNMQFIVSKALQAEQEMRVEVSGRVRQFRVAIRLADTPAADCEGHWTPADPKTVGYFTAVGYFFARELHRRTGWPVGLINASRGSTPIESWMSATALASQPAFEVVAERWRQVLQDYPERQRRYESARRQWQERRKEGAPSAPEPRPPRGPGHYSTPSGYFNAMIHPLIPYAVRGMLWYQGEANHPRAPEYRALFSAFATDLRSRWSQERFPIYYTQISSHEKPTDPSRQMWAYLREAQTQCLALPDTGMAVTIDIGEADDIHPRNKQEVARRLMLIARAKLYDEALEYSGPLLTTSRFTRGRAYLTFSHADGLTTRDGKPPATLQVAGADRVFHPAEGTIAGTTLSASSPAVPAPVAVRYAWSNNPETANLCNRAGLPASPFRTDDWDDFPFSRDERDDGNP